ncbi:RagB/SusD family nutrient uptake outer membrane protein [Chitinophaga sp. Cy-1792]|uniref:RagB/SusD family nutrient uptake outer membrane protein n=1 Tax=Chitinophaga sp. Cy-1792 TaxID=2608339 RepID=UPI00141E4585|nr:RagB/SusD family nutrient uptake outer membrane protein [Chitinophaga sp. Cy-1792]NIG56026.1 RagB/SusD family nutrient uptake outer membrane protein [Chitinophaga sp. Cy-1792]
MKKLSNIIKAALLASGIMMLISSCTKNLLDQQPTTDVGSSFFWKSEDDATYALMGAYNSTRIVFDRDYYYDGQGDYVRVRGVSATSPASSTSSPKFFVPSSSSGFAPQSFGDKLDSMFRGLYGAVNSTNYVIENVNNMIARNVGNKANLEKIVGEARLLRGMTYFRLITMWGDVPYFSKVATSNDDVQTLARMPIAQVKDSIMADFTYAYDKLPAKATQVGRAAKPAALAFRGKLQLFWASWNKNGWPELQGFKPDGAAAAAAFKGAADDFGHVINDFGLTLYKGGDPGNIDTLGGADILPNYFQLFLPTANGDPEMIMVFTHGGIGSMQSEELVREFAGRSFESSQAWITPRYELADRYQSTITGDFCPKLIPMAPGGTSRTATNSALNPKSYANRDYRMKSTMLWDYEKIMGQSGSKSTGLLPFVFNVSGIINIGGINYTAYSVDVGNSYSGYMFRKFIRNYPGQGRSEGDFNWPVMRLADVYLMYAEATNEVNGPQMDAVNLVNKIRHRGNLPPLAGAKYADKNSFFDAIEQERIVELVGEGQRAFDLRRWRKVEKTWGGIGGPGVGAKDTQGKINQGTMYFQNATDRDFSRSYIFKIPQSERDRNPNLTQNTPWL